MGYNWFYGVRTSDAPLSEEYIRWAIQAYDNGTLPLDYMDDDTLDVIEKEQRRRRQKRRAREEEARNREREARIQKVEAWLISLETTDTLEEIKVKPPQVQKAQKMTIPTPIASLTSSMKPTPLEPSMVTSSTPTLLVLDVIDSSLPTTLVTGTPEDLLDDFADSRSNPFQVGEDDVILTGLPSESIQVIDPDAELLFPAPLATSKPMHTAMHTFNSESMPAPPILMPCSSELRATSLESSSSTYELPSKQSTMAIHGDARTSKDAINGRNKNDVPWCAKLHSSNSPHDDGTSSFDQ